MRALVGNGKGELRSVDMNNYDTNLDDVERAETCGGRILDVKVDECDRDEEKCRREGEPAIIWAM